MTHTERSAPGTRSAGVRLKRTWARKAKRVLLGEVRFQLGSGSGGKCGGVEDERRPTERCPVRALSRARWGAEELHTSPSLELTRCCGAPAKGGRLGLWSLDSSLRPAGVTEGFGLDG